jgi:hypothetical protein
MAITLAQLKEKLDRIDLKYMQVKDEEKHAVLLLSWGITDIEEVGNFDVDILLTLQERAENGTGFEFLNVRSRGMEAEANFHQCDETTQMALFRYLLDVNNTVKIGRWCFDKNDGEVVIDHPIAIEQGDIADDQLKRVIHTIVSTAKKGYVALKRIKANGDPEKELENSDKIFNAVLTELAMQQPAILQTLILNREKLEKKAGTMAAIRNLLQLKQVDAAVAMIKAV